MRRDMDLVRKILMTYVDYEPGDVPPDLTTEGYTEEQIGYHVHLMTQAGLVESVSVRSGDDRLPRAALVSVSWAGHDFLEASRDEGLWLKAKHAAGSTGGTALDVLKAVLIGLATKAAMKAAGLS